MKRYYVKHAIGNAQDALYLIMDSARNQPISIPLSYHEANDKARELNGEPRAFE